MIQCACEFLRIFGPLNLLHIRSHPVEIIIIKRLIQGRNNVPGWGLNPDHTIRLSQKRRFCPLDHTADNVMAGEPGKELAIFMLFKKWLLHHLTGGLYVYVCAKYT